MDETSGIFPPQNPQQAPIQVPVPPPPTPTAPAAPIMPPVSPTPPLSPIPPAIPTPVSAATEPVPAQQVKYAGFWIRYVALMVDGLILVIPGLIIQFGLGLGLIAVGVPSKGSSVIAEIIYIFFYWLYFVLMTYTKGATLGKMLVGITVESEDFEKLSFGKVLFRETIGKLISLIIIYIGYIMAAFTQKKQSLHDKMVHSVVVYKEPFQPHSAGRIIGIIIAIILPVITIFGILSAIVLVSLNTARSMGTAVQTESVLTGMRSNAEIYYANNGNSYSSAENCSSGMFASPSFQQFITELSSLGANPVCYADGTSYALSGTVSSLNTAPAAVPPGSFSPASPSTSSFCVDSTGYDGEGKATDNGSVDSCGEN